MLVACMLDGSPQIFSQTWRRVRNSFGMPTDSSVPHSASFSRQRVWNCQKSKGVLYQIFCLCSRHIFHLAPGCVLQFVAPGFAAWKKQQLPGESHAALWLPESWCGPGWGTLPRERECAVQTAALPANAEILSKDTTQPASDVTDKLKVKVFCPAMSIPEPSRYMQCVWSAMECHSASRMKECTKKFSALDSTQTLIA